VALLGRPTDTGRVDLPQHWPLPNALELRDALLAAYADGDRRYHDTRHLADVLAHLGELRKAGTPFEDLPVALAAWFHDSVYDGERDAEERSAVWAEDGLAGLVEEPVRTEVARLVRLTETHRPEDDDPNGCALSDADLAILAATPERYGEYQRAVRLEFAHVGEEDFRDGRAQVLRGILAKETIFHTPYARDAWEDAARANLRRELDELEALAAEAG
jgi:predicted metal-dependent HD superfamily phosphohydrolase